MAHPIKLGTSSPNDVIFGQLHKMIENKVTVPNISKEGGIFQISCQPDLVFLEFIKRAPPPFIAGYLFV